MKRFTRLAIGFSKKLENLAAATALQVAYYNVCWRPRLPGKTGKRRATPAMEAGLTDRLWSLEDLYDAVVKQENERIRAERIDRAADEAEARRVVASDSREARPSGGAFPLPGRRIRSGGLPMLYAAIYMMGGIWMYVSIALGIAAVLALIEWMRRD